jgi:hypothetical protein
VDIAQLSIYILGKPDAGKSNLLARLFLENQDHSKILIDPMGKLTNEVVLPNIEDPTRIIYFAPFEQRRRPLGFNPFDLGKTPDADERQALAGRLSAIFAHLWTDSYRQYANMEMVITNTLNLLVQFEGMTFTDMGRVLIDKRFRTRLASQVKDESLRSYWLGYYRDDMGTSTYNKVNQFIQVGFVGRSICQRRSSFYLGQAMKEGKTIIINLVNLPEPSKALIGALFVSQVLSELNKREGIPTDELPPFGVFVDEFDMFGSRAFETIISKCRQQKGSVCIAHQHWGQLSQRMRHSVIQTAYQICFEVDAITADGLKKQFGSETDLSLLPKHHAQVRLSGTKTGSVPEIDLLKIRKAPDGDPRNAEAVKRAMWPLGRPLEEVNAEISGSTGVIPSAGVSSEHFNEKQKVQPQREEELPRTQADWPARFRQRPSAVFDRVGE